MKLTEDEIKDIVLAWAIRRQILLSYASIKDLAKEITRLAQITDNDKNMFTGGS